MPRGRTGVDGGNSEEISNDSVDEEQEEDAYATAPSHGGSVVCTCARCLRSAGPAREDGTTHIDCIKSILQRCAIGGSHDDELQAYHLWRDADENNLTKCVKIFQYPTSIYAMCPCM